MSALTTRTLSVAYEKHGNYSVSDEAPSRGRSVCASLQNENTHLDGKRFFFPWLKERFKARSSPVRGITSSKRSWSGTADSNQSLFKMKKIASNSLLIFFSKYEGRQKTISGDSSFSLAVPVLSYVPLLVYRSSTNLLSPGHLAQKCKPFQSSGKS